MTIRSHSGKLVVAGVILIAVGGTFLLNLFARGSPKDVQHLLGSPSASATGTVRVVPSSGPATRGVGQRARITLPCGFVAAVDFDESFWRPGGGRSLASVGRRFVQPIDPVTLTLQAEDSTLLRTASGQVVLLVRSRLRSAANPAC